MLLLPFIVPLCGFGLVLAGVPNPLIFSYIPLFFGGIPYLLFSFFAWRWMRSKPRRQILVFGLLAPLLFIPFQVIFMLLLYLLRETALGRWFGGFNLRDCFEISFDVIFFGYIYVVVGFFLWSCFRDYYVREV